MNELKLKSNLITLAKSALSAHLFLAEEFGFIVQNKKKAVLNPQNKYF